MKRELNKIRNKKLYVLDMDGTFYLGDTLVPGSLDFIRTLEKEQKKCLFFTNNSSNTGDYYRKKIQKMGLGERELEIYTSGDVAISYLKNNHPGEKVYLVGTNNLRNNFLEQGVEVDEKDADIVVVGFDTSLTYEKLKKACSLIRNGAEFIATNSDLNCPLETGFIPDCGAICALIEASIGKKPKYMGKPFFPTLEFIVNKTGYHPAEMIIVGDRLYTDIAFGKKSGITSVLVLSGETRRGDAGTLYRPDYVFSSLGEMCGAV